MLQNYFRHQRESNIDSYVDAPDGQVPFLGDAMRTVAFIRKLNDAFAARYAAERAFFSEKGVFPSKLGRSSVGCGQVCCAPLQQALINNLRGCANRISRNEASHLVSTTHVAISAGAFCRIHALVSQFD